MFGTRSRAPSEGALRVLRQLAYISSGTVCGAAALVAEERRRQIGHVSKIADNSRRLKQHPRYHHSQAVPRNLEDFVQQLPENQDDLPHQPDAFRNSVLPSEVEQGYKRLNKHKERHAGGRKQSTKPTRHVAARLADTKPVQSYIHELSHYQHVLARNGHDETLQLLERQCREEMAKGHHFAAERAFCHVVDALGLAKEATDAASRLFRSLLPSGPEKDSLNGKQLRALSLAQRYLIVWMEAKHMPSDAAVHELAAWCATHPSTVNNNCLRILYQTHSNSSTFSQNVYRALCVAHADIDVHATALLFVKHVQPSERLSILASCKPAWGSILNQLWTTTRNLDLVMATFKDMCQLAGPNEPGLDMYNTMIFICIRANRIDEARNYLRTIQESDYMDPDIGTFGHFVSNSAAASNWAVVDESLQALSQKLPSEVPFENRDGIFASVLSEYVKEHSPEEIRDFASQAIETQGVPPTQEIANIVIRAFARLRHLEYISPWMDYMRAHGVTARINPYLAQGLVRQFYFDSRPSHENMVWLCRRLVRHVPDYKSEGLFSLLREAVAYDIRGYQAGQKDMISRATNMFKMLEVSKADGTNLLPRPNAWWEVQGNMSGIEAVVPPVAEPPVEPSLGLLDPEFLPTPLKPQEPTVAGASTPSHVSKKSHQRQHYTENQERHPLLLNDSPSTIVPNEVSRRKQRETDMLIAISTDRPEDALKIYQESVAESGLPASPFALELAVQAQQMQSMAESTEMTDDLLGAARDAGSNIMAAIKPVLMKRVRNADISSPLHIQKVCNTVRGFYEHNMENNIPIKHHLATATATVLIKNGKADEAIRLLSAIYHSPAGQSVPLDMVAMTVFLQAYLSVRHHQGIVWVIDQVLKHDYPIDRPFLLVLQRSRKEFRLNSYRGGHHAMKYSTMSRTLGTYLGLCQQRQHEQKRKAMRFGNKLINMMIRMANGSSVSTSASGAKYRFVVNVGGPRRLETARQSAMTRYKEKMLLSARKRHNRKEKTPLPPRRANVSTRRPQA